MDDLSVLDAVDVTLFRSKFVSGGERGVHGPLLGRLERWETDVHYVTYTEATETRLRKVMAHGPLSFRAMVFDADAHGGQRPKPADFDALVAAASRLSHRPTWISQSRSGAHLLYPTTEITDPATYEATRAAFMSAALGGLRGRIIYELDQRTPDWTRLFRSPRTMRLDHDDDGLPDVTDLRGSRVVVLHGDVLDLAPLTVAPAPSAPRPAAARRPTQGSPAGAKSNGHDAVIRNYLNSLHPEGERNPSLFKAACWAFKRYCNEDAEILTGPMQDHAQREGLPEHEAEAVVRSARRCVERERNAADVR